LQNFLPRKKHLDICRNFFCENIRTDWSVEELTALALACLYDDPNPKHGNNFEVPWDWRKHSITDKVSKASSIDEKNIKKS